MPGTNEIILKKVQAGIEATPGTGVAATRKVYAQMSSTYDRPLANFQDTTGTFSARRRVMYGRPNVGFSGTDICTYEDLAWWFQLLLKGGVTGSEGSGAPKPYTYAFVPSLSTDDLKSLTLEFGEPNNAYKSTQVMANSFTIRGDSDSDDEPGWMLDVEMMGRDWSSSSYTGSITDRTTEVIITRGTKVYVDEPGGTIGTTQMTGRIISFSLTGNINRHMKAFMEDELAYAANKYGRGERTFDAQIVMEFDSDTEFAKYRSTTPVQRLIRIEREGTTISGAVKKKATIDLAGYYSSFAEGDREGNMIATFGVSGYFDQTLGYDCSATVVNALATLP